MASNRHATRPALATLALALAAGLGAGSVHAEDIDIYGGSNIDATVPNVLFFLDNTSNWSAANQAWAASGVWSAEQARASADCTVSGVLDTTCRTAALTQAQSLIEDIYYAGTTGKLRPWQSGFAANRDDIDLKQGQVELRALKLVLQRTVCKVDATLRLKVGLMLISRAGTVRSNGDAAGYIRRAVRELTTTADAGGTSTCAAFLGDLTTIDARINDPDFKAPASADYSAPLYEAFKYFGGWSRPGASGAATPVGAQGYGPVRFSNANEFEDPAAFADVAKTTYRSPVDPAGCSRGFIVVVGNGYPNAEPNAGPARFQGLGYTPPTLTEDPSRLADEWTQFLVNTDASSADNKQGIATYTINVYKARPDVSQGTLLRSMAQHGGGEYNEVGGSLTKLFDSFNDLLIKLASVDSVFTATTLPVSTTTQGTYLNQLFIGMFRPEGNGKPRWVGNLKQYKLGQEDNGDVRVVDMNGRRALNGGTGFFNPLATSYWTGSSVFFTNHKMGTPESASDAPDGPIVEKGGVAQRLREANLSNASGRRLYTLPASPTGGASLSSYPFTLDTLGAGEFTSAEISWIRGENNVASGAGMEYAGAASDGAGGTTNLTSTGPRPSIHGDILHSRPVAVNYGSRVVVYYGSNDGALHAIDGNQSGDTAGQELWSFIAPEHYDMLHRQRSDRPALWLPSTDAEGHAATRPEGTRRKDYAFDGPLGLFARYSRTTGALVEGKIYAAMRRGGRAVYAFDVTSPTAPTFLWKITPATTGFSRLGQTWSMPRPVVFPPAYSADPILFMGGGYDPAAEDDGATESVGNRVYFVNGRTGARLGRVATDHAVPSDVTVVDTNGDRVYDRAYVADVRGNLYRITMTDNRGALLPVASWTIRKIAALGGKVFYAPDVVVTRSYVAVLVGTGDREKPLLESTTDRFFLVKDTLPGAAERDDVLTVSDLTRVARVDERSTSEVAFTDVVTPVDDANGCYLALSTRGEKVVNAPYTIAGVTYFGTNRPTPDATSCTGSRGQARSYQFPLFCGVPKGSVLDGGGMPPSPVGGLVSMTGRDGRPVLVPFVIGSGADKSPFEAERPHPPMSQSRRRNFWQVNDGSR